MMLLNRSAQAAFSGKAARPAKANRAKLVCRAEEKSIAKVDRSKDQLYVGASQSSLAYLDGTLPGDFGFDPLGLLDPVNSGGFVEPKWLQYSEVIHARWAMLGAAGCIAPEILGAAGLIPEKTNIVWYESGVIPPAGSYDSYWADPYTIFFIEIVAMQFAELRRLQDFRYPGSMGKQYFLGLEKIFEGSGDAAYPGGPFFNLFNLGKTEAAMKELKLKEIKNGRLAMLAMLGYGAQATLTREGPFQNLLDHLADPVNNNILTNFGKAFAPQ
ncbi:Photosystem I chlorophyll a/b-binding protein 3-1, chloroplastic [Pleodorina starrii]|uniref:Chlorophyll a-b binding protein, chloroplastic n=1 Tax=Pleodorina starrii TaxID=330485 RepID=A0A9W6BGJ7_9CHLO|nr:Photosystem I chlorophyll a/b-binding protein 3-1 [Pleodorina starrii]GLC51739.1 Photosystem I chlorophyll a/b-binding protein 3-1, chloroplastic [Pleodorina starrii]GLC77102.1 Photosystem I chlorophyll a/b-binding protein 3-1 [Pleodorina starrii]